MVTGAGFPAEFSDLLSRAGRRLLDGDHPLAGALADPRRRFLQAGDLVDPRKAARLRVLLESEVGPTLEPIDRPIPPESIWEMTEDYAETLPKTTRAGTVYFDDAREPGARAAARIGLARMLRSDSFHRFAERLAGRPLAKKHGIQLLRYGPGDYAGPHNDHHPGEPKARHGYVDIHLSLASPTVEHQWLVHARAGHFSEIVSVAGPAIVTAYRLPFWHYTTPLAARPGRERQAVRWVLLGTFLFADAA